MNDIEARLKRIVELKGEMETCKGSLKSTLLAILTQSEALSRQIRQKLGHQKPEPAYQEADAKRREKYRFKQVQQKESFEAIECCGRLFRTKQGYYGHLKAKQHQKG